MRKKELLGPSFRVQQMSGRNRSELVTTATAAFLVKVFDTAEQAARETAALAWFSASDNGCGVSTPRVRVVDGRLLITETPPGLRTLSPAIRKRRLSAAVLRRLGRSLAQLHAIRLPPESPSSEYLPLDPEGASLAVLSESFGVRATLAEVHRDEPLLEALRTLAERPQSDRRAVHGDIRAANILVGKGRPSDPELYLIDWETAGIADPMVDVGAAIAQVLAISMHASTTGPDRVGLRLLLESYRAGGGELHLASAIRRAGVSLIQKAIESTASADVINGPARTSLRIARIALLTPESLAVQLRLVT